MQTNFLFKLRNFKNQLNKTERGYWALMIIGLVLFGAFLGILTARGLDYPTQTILVKALINCTGYGKVA